MKTTR